MIQIRKAVSSDIGTLKEMARSTIDANYRPFLGNEKVNSFLGSGISEQYIDDNIDNCWVILEDIRIVGLSVCKANLVDLLMIDNEYHRQGFGATLLKHCEEILFKRFDEIMLESFEGNEKADNFYRKYGWLEVERNFDEASGVNKIKFVKNKQGIASSD